MRIGLIGISILVVIVGCTSTKNKMIHPEELATFSELIEGKSYRFDAKRAYPMPSQAFNAVANSGILPPGSNSGVIDLTTTVSFVEVHGDSISGNLPFYGERQLGGGPGAPAGIAFKGIAKSYEANYNGKQQRYDIKISVAGEQELFQLQLKAFPSGSTDLLVMSNTRTTISYDGTLEALEVMDK